MHSVFQNATNKCTTPLQAEALFLSPKENSVRSEEHIILTGFF